MKFMLEEEIKKNYSFYYGKSINLFLIELVKFKLKTYII